MNADEILQELTVLEQQLSDILDEDGRNAIAQAIRDVRDIKEKRPTPAASRNRHKARTKAFASKPWQLRVPPGTPIRFIPTSLSAAVRHQLIVDVFCSISESRDGIPLGDHTIVIRVWTEDDNLWFREHLDAETLFDSIVAAGGRRVIHRVHLDYANPGQPGPQFHLQVGGGQHGGEFCWFPDNLKVPRFCHYPMSLITTCEFIVRTFFPQHYERISLEATWIGAIRKAQEAYLEPYFKKLLRLPTKTPLSTSLLDRMWNPLP